MKVLNHEMSLCGGAHHMFGPSITRLQEQKCEIPLVLFLWFAFVQKETGQICIVCLTFKIVQESK